MTPFLLDPGCAELLTTDAFRERYLSQVAPARKGIVAVITSTIPLWPTLILALVGICISSEVVLAVAMYLAFPGLLFSGIFLYGTLRGSKHFLRLRHLARHGKLVEGRLIACKQRVIPTDSDSADPVVWSVDYEVTAPSGRVLRRTAMRDTKPAGPIPPAGTPVVVLMLDENLFDIL